MATWPTITDDDGSGSTGTILDQSLFNSIRDYAGVAWTAVTFSAGNFTANNAMTWTVASGDQTAFNYVEHGKTMHVSAYLVTTSVGGTPSSQLRITLPNGRTADKTTTGSFAGTNNGTAFSGVWESVAGTTYIALFLDANSATWAASTNNTAVRLLATVSIQ